MTNEKPLGKQPQVPPSGVWCPAVTLFDKANDNLDLPSQEKYYKHLSSTGLRGLVILGTNAEAFLLTREERFQLIEIARKAVGPIFPIMAGVGAHSTRQVLDNIGDAVKAGADYALVLPPAYFGKATTPAVIMNFFDDIAAKSPLPIVIYNFPGVCNGVDLDSDMITAIAKKHSNVVGVKLTCGSVGKITRLSRSLSPDEFAIFGGQSDFLIGGLAAGSSGCIAAFANVAPTTVVQVYDLYQTGNFAEALKLHQEAALAESPCKLGIGPTKFAAAITTARAAGIENTIEKMEPRRPYGAPSEAVKDVVRAAIERLQKFESTL